MTKEYMQIMNRKLQVNTSGRYINEKTLIFNNNQGNKTKIVKVAKTYHVRNVGMSEKVAFLHSVAGSIN